MASSIWQLIDRVVSKKRLLELLTWYPPYLGAGIRVTKVADDLSLVEVEMPLTRLNQNFVGTQFGGSLYSMCDPFFMILLLFRLGQDYVVWDKAASIQFLKPGRGRVRARFELSDEQVAHVRADADRLGKVEPRFEARIVDEAGEVIARVDKVVYVRRKDRSRNSAAPARVANA